MESKLFERLFVFPFRSLYFICVRLLFSIRIVLLIRLFWLDILQVFIPVFSCQEKF